MEAHVDGTKCH